MNHTPRTETPPALAGRTTTPTGIEISTCHSCGNPHPVQLAHCAHCGRASHFLSPTGTAHELRCLTCRDHHTPPPGTGPRAA